MPHMEGIFINGEKAKFHPEDILDTNASQYTEEIGTATKEWLSENLSKYETIIADSVDEPVQNWLDEHPEATTTVQDGSLTEAKFTNSLKHKTLNNYVTPEMYGAVGDGTTDDTPAFVSMISDVGSTGVVRLLEKTYRLTNTLTLPVGLEFGGMGVSSVIKVDHGNNAFDLTDGYSGNYIHDFTIIGGRDSTWCFKVARPQCTFERLYFPSYNGDGFAVTNGNVTGGYATFFKSIKFIGVKDTAFARKQGIRINVNGGLVVVDKCNFALCSKAVVVENCAGVFIKNSNISECNHSLVPITSDNLCYGIYCTGGNTVSITDCYLENANTLIASNGAKNISLNGCYINLLAQSVIGCNLTGGEKFTMNNCYFKSSYSSAVGVSVGSNFNGLVDLTGNVFDIDSGNIYQGNKRNVLYNDNAGYFLPFRQKVTCIDSSVTNITEAGNYVASGTINITLTTSSITATGMVINIYVSSGTTTITFPYAYGDSRTYTLTGGMGISIIKNPNGYYSALGTTPS